MAQPTAEESITAFLAQHPKSKASAIVKALNEGGHPDVNKEAINKILYSGASTYISEKSDGNAPLWSLREAPGPPPDFCTIEVEGRYKCTVATDIKPENFATLITCIFGLFGDNSGGKSTSLVLTGFSAETLNAIPATLKEWVVIK